MGVSSSTSGIPLRYGYSLFELAEQPHEKQRKSYLKENRFLLPNALCVKMRRLSNGDFPINIETGTVTVQICFENGELLKSEEYLDGELKKLLDSECRALFSLRLLKASSHRKFKLLFQV